MKNKKLLMCAVAIALCSVNVQDFASAATVADYSELTTQIGLGDPAIDLSLNIAASAGDARITNTAGTTAITLTAGQFIQGPSTLGGLFENTGTLTITGGGAGAAINTGNGTAAAVINTGTFNANGTFTIGGGINQASGATVIGGGGTVTLTGNTTNITGGSLTIQDAGTTLQLNDGSLTAAPSKTINSGTTLAIGGASVSLVGGNTTWDGAIDMASGALSTTALSETTTATSTYNQSGGSLFLTGGSSLNLATSDSAITGGNAYVGTAGNSLTFDNGTANTATLAIAGGTVTVDTGSTFTTAATGNDLASGSSGSLVVDGTFNLSNTDSAIVGATITGAGAINKDAAGTAIFTAANSGFTGSYSQTAGDIQIQNEFFEGDNSFTAGNVSVNAAAGDLTLDTGDTWNGSGINVTAGSVTLDGFTHTANAVNGAYTQSGTGSLDLQNGSGLTLEGASAITAGNVNLTGTGVANTLTINGGTLGSGATVSIANGDTLAVAGGTATLDATDTWAGDVGVSGGTLTLNGVTHTASVVNGAYNQSAGALALTNNTTLTLETGSDITGGSVNVGAAGNSLTFDNGVVNTGTLSITGGTATVNTGSTFTTAATGNTLTSGSLVVDGTVNLSNTDNMTVGTAITGTGIGAGTINKDAAGSIIFTADNSGFSGAYNQTAGDIEIQNAFFAGDNSFTGGNVSINNAAGALTLGSGGTWNGSDIDVSAGSLTLDGFSHTASAANGAYTQSGTGTLTLQNSSDLTLGTGSSITGGTVDVGAAGNSLTFDNAATNTATLSITGGTATVNTGSTFTTAATGNTLTSGSLVADGTFNFSNTDSTTVGTTITGAGTINKDAAGTIIFTADNSGFSGTYTQTAGDIQIQNAFLGGDNIFTGGNVSINNASGALTLDINDTWNGSDIDVSAGSLTLDGFSHTANVANGGYVQTAGALTLTNNTALTLGTGSSITGGSVDVGAAGNSLTFDNGLIHTATLSITGGTATVNTSSAFITAATGNVLSSGSLVVDGTFNFSNTDNMTVGTAITGTGAINKDAAGTIIFTADNSGFSGAYSQTAGDIEIQDAFFAGDNTFSVGNVSINNAAGALTLDSGDIWNGSDIDVTAGSVTLDGFTHTANVANGTYNQTAGALTLQNNASLTLEAGSDITGGTINVGAAGNSITFDSGSVASSATLLMNGGTVTIASGTFRTAATGNNLASGSLVNNGAFIFSNTDSTTVGATITGIGDIHKSGTGTVIFTADNSGFTGNYNITAGTMEIQNTFFTGNGNFVAGNVDITSNGSLILNAGDIWSATNFDNDGSLSLVSFDPTGTRTGTYTQDAATSSLALSGNSVFITDVGDTITNGNVSVADTATLSIDNGIVGSANLTMTGGTLNVTGNSTFTADAAGTTLTAGDVNVVAGSTFEINSNSTWTGVDIDNAGTFNLNGTNTTGRTGDYTQSAAGSVINLSNGAILGLRTGDTLANGTVNIVDSTSVLGLLSGATWTNADINNNGLLVVNSTNDTGRTGSYTQTSAGGTLYLENGANMTLIAGDTVSNGSVAINNAGTVLTLNNGVNSATLALSDGLLDISSGSTYQTGTSGNSYTGGTINVNGTLDFQDNDDNTVFSIITGSGIINKTGTDTLTFAADNSAYTGDFNLYAGNVRFINGSHFGGTTILNGASPSNLAMMDVIFNSDATYGQKVTMLGNAELTVDTGNHTITNYSNTTITGTPGTNSTLRKVGTGTYAVDRTGASADFNYKVAVDAGTMSVTANTTQFNDTVSVTGSTLSVASDNLNFNNGLILSNGTLNVLNRGFNVTSGGMSVGSTVNTMNGVVAANNITGNLNVGSSGTANFLIDIDARNRTSDNYNISGSITSTNPTGIINISDYNLIGGSPIDSDILLSVFNPTGTIDPGITFTQTLKGVNTPIGTYGLLSLGNGFYDFKLTEFNPQVYRGQVATVASYANQLTTNNMLFDHISVVSQQLWAAEHNKKSTTVDEYKYDKKDGNIWYKAFGNIENLRLSQNISTANNMWGSIIGADFPLVEMGNGWSLLPTAYIAYTGGYQAYSGLGMYQNGGQGGLMGTFYKGNFIQTFLTNVGGYGNDMSFSGTKDTTGNWFAGVASKTAYNIALPQDLVLQPTLLLSYNAFGGQNWHTDYGDMTMKTNSLNGLLLAPGLNLILNKETWSAYATTQLMFNLMDDCNGLAGNVSLPTIAMGTGYFQYGVGVMKRIKDKFSLYGQIVLSNGTRTGIGFQGGFLWRF